jgi:hypothetical protein
MESGKHYMSWYHQGATKQQDERPYEHDGPMIDCIEVELKEVTKKEWTAVNIDEIFEV